MSKEELAKLLMALESKNSWGKNEIKELILRILAGLDSASGTRS